MFKQKRKEKGGKWDVPLPKVKAVGEDEVFKVIKLESLKKAWKGWSPKFVMLVKVLQGNHPNTKDI